MPIKCFLALTQNMLFSGFFLFPLRGTLDIIIGKMNYFIGRDYIKLYAAADGQNPQVIYRNVLILKLLVVSMPISLSGKKSGQKCLQASTL